MPRLHDVEDLSEWGPLTNHIVYKSRLFCCPEGGGWSSSWWRPTLWKVAWIPVPQCGMNWFVNLQKNLRASEFLENKEALVFLFTVLHSYIWDTVFLVAGSLAEMGYLWWRNFDLFPTDIHATERQWESGYSVGPLAANEHHDIIENKLWYFSS